MSVRPVDSAVLISTSTGALVRWTGPGQCSGVNALTSGLATAIKAFDGSTFVGSFSGSNLNSAGNVALFRLRPDGGSPSSQTVGFGQVWELSGPSINDLYAAGWDHSTQLRNRVWQFDPGGPSWSPVVSSNNMNTPLFTIDVPSPSLGFTAGRGFIEWNGAVWTYRPDPPFDVFTLKVISSNEVYAAGYDGARIGFALWDGNMWRLLGPSPAPMGAINRMRGSSRCRLLNVGNGGNAVSTFP